MAMQQKQTQVANNKRRVVTRLAVSAAHIAPLVRPMVAQEFAYRRNSDAVARAHGIGRIAVIECGFSDHESRMAAIERRLGIITRRAA